MTQQNILVVPPEAQELRAAAKELERIQVLMRNHDILHEGYSYDKQLSGLIYRCLKKATTIIYASN